MNPEQCHDINTPAEYIYADVLDADDDQDNWDDDEWRRR